MEFTLSEDTICAIATPIGEGGIGIIRISGKDALPIASKLFQPSRSTPPLESHRLYHGWIKDPGSAEVIDEVLLSYMSAPRTYTREDVVEINCHSGFAVLSHMLQLVIQGGARLAEPGEFTRRAFLNGRIDLSQAEAVIDVIHSRSEKGLALANRHLRGDFRDQVLSWRELLLDFQSELEAAIDFSEDLDDDLSDPRIFASRIDEAVTTPLTRMLTRYESGRILRDGLTLVLVGKPNVGKSSLLNALLGRDRAIVTPHPGTTRDVIEDSFTVSGVEVRILDTAGIRHEPDEIESLGIERTLRSIEEAAVILWLMDKSRPLTPEDDAVFLAICAKHHVMLLNKADLPPTISVEEARSHFGTDAPAIELSVLNADDIEHLLQFVEASYIRQPCEALESMIVPNLRHKECLEHAAGALERMRKLLESGGWNDLVSFELNLARIELESILGMERDEGVLDRIFSRFCIGK